MEKLKRSGCMELEMGCPADQCSDLFYNRRELQNHVIVHHKGLEAQNKIKCSQCNYLASRPCALQRHMLRHGGKKIHRCDLCGYETGWLSALSKHAARHASSEPLPCPHCKLVFYSKRRLSSHILVHTGGGHKCDICGRRFRTKILLQKHQALHGEASLHCSLCDYKCRYSSALNQHIRSAHQGIGKRTSSNKPNPLESQDRVTDVVLIMSVEDDENSLIPSTRTISGRKKARSGEAPTGVRLPSRPPPKYSRWGKRRKSDCKKNPDAVKVDTSIASHSQSTDGSLTTDKVAGTGASFSSEAKKRSLTFHCVCGLVFSSVTQLSKHVQQDKCNSLNKQRRKLFVHGKRDEEMLLQSAAADELQRTHSASSTDSHMIRKLLTNKDLRTERTIGDVKPSAKVAHSRNVDADRIGLVVPSISKVRSSTIDKSENYEDVLKQNIFFSKSSSSGTIDDDLIEKVGFDSTGGLLTSDQEVALDINPLQNTGLRTSATRGVLRGSLLLSSVGAIGSQSELIGLGQDFLTPLETTAPATELLEDILSSSGPPNSVLMTLPSADDI